MDFVKSVTLGIVQGITEWLPVSSSAHLIIVPELLRWPDPGAPATAVMQLGTMVAVLIYFAKDIQQTLIGFFKALQPGGDKNSPEARLAMAVLLGTIPVCIVALLLKKYIEGVFRGNYIMATSMIVVGIMLYVAEKLAKKVRPLSDITVRDGIIVGTAQCFALVPGTSRSGSTLIGAFLTGLTKEAALRFSFLLSIPAVLLSGLYELYDTFIKHHAAEPSARVTMEWTTPDLILTTVVAGVVGYFTIAFLLKYLQNHSTLVFVIYRVLLGLLLIGLTATGYLTNH